MGHAAQDSYGRGRYDGEGKSSKRSKDRSPSSSVERKEAKFIVLPAMPTIARVVDWKLKFYQILADAAGRKKDSDVIEWIRKVEHPQATLEDFSDPKRFRTLERKLAVAFKIAGTRLSSPT